MTIWATNAFPIVPDTGTGILETQGSGILPQKRYFVIAPPDNLGFVDIYINNAGVAKYLGTYPVEQYVDVILAGNFVGLSDILMIPGTRPSGGVFGRTTNNTLNKLSGYTEETTDPNPYANAANLVQWDGSNSLIAFHGDSMTVPFKVTDGYMTRAMRQIYQQKGYKYDYKIRGVSGIGFTFTYYPGPPADLLADAVTEIDPLLLIGSYTRRQLVILCGTNDIKLNGKTGAQTYAALQAYIAARVAAGWNIADIYVLTCLPREGGIDGQRIPYNNLIMADVSGFKKVPIHTDMLIGQDGDQANPVYYIDTIHPTSLGHKIIAPYLVAAMP